MLRFEFLPRRRIRGLRLTLTLLTLAILLGAGTKLALQRSELNRLQDELMQGEQQIAKQRANVPRPASAPWEAQAASDAELLTLPIDARLLELEHCIKDGMSISNFKYDASSSVLTVGVQVDGPDRVSGLVACLNQPTGRWVLDSVATQSADKDAYVVVLHYLDG